MLYIILIVVIGVLVFLLTKQTQKVKALEAAELEHPDSQASELEEALRKVSELTVENEKLRQASTDHVLSIELLAGELDMQKKPAGKRAGARKPIPRLI